MNSINLLTPDGYDEIVETFGDLHSFIDDSGNLTSQWNTEHLGVSIIPFSIPLSWNKGVLVRKITCNKVLIPIITDVFNQIDQNKLGHLIKNYGGCFNFRQQRGSSKLSCHSWGIAIDLNTDTNEMGTSGDMDPQVIKVFEDNGFYWGGNFSGKRQDPMHFQFATGY